MAKNKNVLSAYAVLMLVIVLAAVATWLIPAGAYHRLSYTGDSTFLIQRQGGEQTLPFTQHTLDSLHISIPLQNFETGAIKKPISVPGSYQQLPASPQGLMAILQAPIKGIYESVDIILFILAIGGFMQLFNESGIMFKAVGALSRRMKGREAWLIIILGFLFSLGGASYGMAEEGMAFYAILIPVFIAAGYDLLVPVAVIFGGTQLGTLASFTNPFSTIIASHAAGISWTDGLWQRVFLFAITSILFIIYTVRYAERIKKNPEKSLLYGSNISIPFISGVQPDNASLTVKEKCLLGLFFACFAVMVFGVVRLDWWLTEMTTLFLATSILFAAIQGIRENIFCEQFINGARELLGVAFIVGIARAVTIVLNDGHIGDSIVFYAAGMSSSLPPALFIIMLLALYMLFTLFIASSSGMAVLTMPIMGSLGLMLNVPGREIVNAYLFGMGIVGFVSPTGLMLPALAISNVTIKAWWKFIYPFLILLTIICALSLVIGIYWV